MPRRVVVKPANRNFNRWACFKEAFRDCWQGFGEASSIHGISYLIQTASSGVQKFIWSSILLVCSVLASVFMYYLWLRYMETPTRTTVRSQHIPSSTVPFPAITICPSSMIPREHVEHFLNSHWQNIKTKFNQSTASEKIYRAAFQVGAGLDRSVAKMEDMEVLEHFLKTTDFKFLNFLFNVSLPCRELFLKCRWDDQIIECDKLFSDLLTSNGYCCSFNFHMGQRKSAHSQGFGLFSGLDIAISYLPFNAYGENIFRIYFHDPLTFPTNTMNSFLAAEQKETVVALNVRYIFSDKNLRKLSPKDRKCVFKDEYELQYFSSFTYENCMSECQLKRFKQICGCVPHYLAPISRKTSKFCTPTKYLCIAKYFQKVLSIQASENFSVACNCPLECDLLMIDAKVSESKFQATNLSVNSFYTNITRKESILHVFLAKSCTVEYTKVLSLRGITFTANLGGLISLFLGCSFVSVLEIFFYFGYRLFKRYKQIVDESNVFFITRLYLKFFKGSEK